MNSFSSAFGSSYHIEAAFLLYTLDVPVAKAGGFNKADEPQPACALEARQGRMQAGTYVCRAVDWVLPMLRPCRALWCGCTRSALQVVGKPDLSGGHCGGLL